MTTVTITKLKFHLLANLDDRGNPIPQWKVGAACGINPDTMSNYARGTRSFLQNHLHALCDYFDCEPSELDGTIDIEIPDGQEAAG